jgi:hypothetical protein
MAAVLLVFSEYPLLPMYHRFHYFLRYSRLFAVIVKALTGKIAWL